MAVIVNGTRIENDVIEKEVERLRPDYEKNVPAQKPEMARFHLLDQAKTHLIERVLLSQESNENAPEISSEAVAQMYNKVTQQSGGEKQFLKKYKLSEKDIPAVKKDLEHQLKHEALIDSVTSGSEPSESEVDEYFQLHAKQFAIPGRVKASHIVANIDDKQDEAEAKKIISEALRELESGKEFSEVARKYSSCPSKGGSLGWFPRGQMVQEFEDVVFEQQVGTYSHIFLSPFGYHIALVEDREEDNVPEFAEIKERLFSQIKIANAQKKMKAFIDELRSKAEIVEA